MQLSAGPDNGGHDPRLRDGDFRELHDVHGIFETSSGHEPQVRRGLHQVLFLVLDYEYSIVDEYVAALFLSYY